MEAERLDRLIQWRRGEKPGPWTVSIYPTYRCNLKCSICWKRCAGEPLRPSEELSDAHILKLVDESADLGVSDWIIGGAGELMLRADLVMDLCARIRRRNMNGIIQTNGTCFSDKNLSLLVEMGWRSISVSIDGATAEINDDIRCKGAYEKSVATIKALNHIRRLRNTFACTPHIVSVVTSLNCDSNQLELLVRMAHDLDCHLALVPLITYGETTRRFELSPEQERDLPAAIGHALGVAGQLNVACNLDMFLEGIRYSRRAMDLFNEPEGTISQRTMCYEPWLSLVVKPTGHAGPCCTMDYFTKADNVRDKSLAEIWYGGYMEQVRRGILSGKPPSYCGDCSTNQVSENGAIQRNEALWLAVTALQRLNFRHLSKRALAGVRRHGFLGALRRGSEWLQIRRSGKKAVR